MLRSDPERDIRWLLAEKYHGKQTLAARRDIKRLERGEHIAYVIGWVPFLSVKVDLSQKPLIPRPETEYWAEQVVQDIRSSSPVHQFTSSPLIRVLDAFSGSGCIGLAVLARVPEARVTFADIEPRYFKGVRKSARWNGLPSRRFTMRHSDILKNVRMSRYDYILANPPYIPNGRRLPASLRQEPQKALYGGKDGLRYIRSLLRQAPKHLAPGGKLVIEFDSMQKSAIGALAKSLRYRAEFRKDQYGKWRWVIMQRDSSTSSE